MLKKSRGAGRRSKGTLKERIIALHKAHPTMSLTVIAERVGTRPGYVWTVLRGERIRALT